MKELKLLTTPVPLRRERTEQEPNLRFVLFRALEDLYSIGFLEEMPDEKILGAFCQKALAKQRQIEATGLTIARDKEGNLLARIIPACLDELHPSRFLPRLAEYYEKDPGWGYVNSDYYGTVEEPKDIPHGIGDELIGEVCFLVEDSAAPGYNEDIPGGFLGRYAWGEERNQLLAEWKEGYQKKLSGLQMLTLNYALYGLILLGYDDMPIAPGAYGAYDFVGQPHDAAAGLCPYGDVCGGEPRWSAGGADADSDYVVAVAVC